MKDIYVNSFNAFENFQSKKLEGKKTLRKKLSLFLWIML